MNSRRWDWGLSRRDSLRFLSSVVVGAPIASRVAIANPATSGLPREGVIELGDFPLHSVETLQSGKLAYKTHGQLNAARATLFLPDPVCRSARVTSSGYCQDEL